MELRTIFSIALVRKRVRSAMAGRLGSVDRMLRKLLDRLAPRHPGVLLCVVSSCYDIDSHLLRHRFLPVTTV